MYLSLSLCVLFIHLCNLKWEQFLNNISLSLLLGFAANDGTGAIIIVPLTSLYASL